MQLGFGKYIRIILIALFALAFTATSFCDPLSGGNTQNDSKTRKQIDHLRKLAARGHVPEQIELAAAYMTGRGVPQDLIQAAHWYQRAALSGDPDAENQIGYLCQYGIGVPVDPIRAFHWYQLASASGSLQAKVNMGVSYLIGMGVRANPSTARQLFLEAAQKGSGLGAAYLGDVYLLGSGVARDPAESEKWFAMGVRQHDPVAAFNLAYLFSIAADHEHDLARAVHFLQLSAAKGYVPGIHQLGLLLVRHPELADSPQQAVSLLQESSTAGTWKSSVILGILARDGRTAPADPALASYYFHLAVLQGGDKASRYLAAELANLASKLPPGEDSARAAQAGQAFQQRQLPMLFVLRENEQQKHFPVAAIADYGAGFQSGYGTALQPGQ